MGISVTVSAPFLQLMKSQLYVFIYLQLPHIILYLKFNSYIFVFFNFLLLCGGSYTPAYVVRQVCGDLRAIWSSQFFHHVHPGIDAGPQARSWVPLSTEPPLCFYVL